MKKSILAIALIAAIAVPAVSYTANAASKETKPAAKPAASSASAAASTASSASASSSATTANAVGPSGRPADWRVLNTDNNTEMSVDAASIRQIGSMREVWAMWNFKEARENKGDPTFPALKSYQDMYIVNCEEKTMRLSREIIYAGNYGTGDKRDHSDALTNMSYEKPVLDSVAEAMVQEVCKFKIQRR
ncbi:surface-adhesin E family protein [Undibacterium terreum]|uniref:Surface-adhesin protein E-like domain-containing protein n=1 Tax=Undibacterium terreum TaxID=1224302 RepID=A0A916UFD1_9BURK|nr:surface-adhesin E family protein [Undibacterium terreum]GGC68902.1 hypothetical protein GCM10011396_14870 [Undibacterium terreum]